MKIWPAIMEYSGKRLAKVAMPLGGIGTGSVSLGGRGNLRDWEVMNRPAKGFVPLSEGQVAPFFALHIQPAGGDPVTRLLEGPLDRGTYEGGSGCEVPNHGLPRFRECAFRAAYPLAQVALRDAQVPVAVTLQAFNPLVPADSDASGLPVAVLRYVVQNPTAGPLTVTVCGTLPNFIGIDGSRSSATWSGALVPAGECENVNEWKAEEGLRGIRLSSRHADTAAEAWGTLALATPGAGEVTHRLHWLHDVGWAGERIDFWDDLRRDGRLDDRPDAGEKRPVASLALTQIIPAGEEAAFPFLLTWHFPNRRSWNPGPEERRAIIGNYYCTRFADAWAAAVAVARAAGA